MSEFKSSLNNSSVFGSELLQRVSCRIKLLTPCRYLLWLSALRQNLNQDLYNASDFDEKTVFRKLKLLENSISKNHLFGQFSPWKRQSKLFCAFSTKLFRKKFFLLIKKFWIKIFGKKISFWIIFLYNASYFQSNFSNASDLEQFF